MENPVFLSVGCSGGEGECVAGIVFWKCHVCFPMCQSGMMGSAEQWSPNAHWGVFASLAASEPPGSFVKVTCS